APVAGTIAGSIDITANASDNTGVVGVQFQLNGNNLGAEDITAPYSFTWNTSAVADGSYTLTGKARDAAGNIAISSPVVVNVLNHPPDTQFPTVVITAPSAGEVLGNVTITADASDNVGIIGVQFLLNGNNLGAEDISAPYSVSWNTGSLTNGAYTLTARTRDAAGNITTSADVVVTVNNPGDTQLPSVTIAGPTTGNVSGTINVTASASDNVSVTGVTFLLDGNPIDVEDTAPPYSISWNTLTASNGQHTLTAKAKDAAGNIGTSAGVIVNVNNDLTPPTVTITSPAAGNVSGMINVTTNASDNVGVVGVQFLLDGVNLGVEDITAPYSVSWNTLTAGNGPHVLTANARDAAGNLGTSTNVSVTVNNDLTPPTVTVTSPAAGNVSGPINVTANASDNIGIVGVQFLLDGVNLGTEDLASPYSVSWKTVNAINGQHVLTAKARDAAGNITTSTAITVTVSNVTNLITAIHFNEGTGTTAADVSGKSHNGTLTGGATWTTGKFGQAVNLNGTNNYVNIADHADYTLNPTQSYTWSAWVKNNNFNEWSTVWGQALNATNFFYFYAHTTSQNDGGAGPVTNGISVYWTTGSSKVALHSNNNVLTAGQWSHVTVTYDRFSIYVNGTDVTNRSAVGSTGTITTIDPTGIRIGSNSAFGEYLNGAIDEVRFYNRLLTVTEIQNDMNTPIGIDNTAPTVNVSGPPNNSFVSGTINVTGNASDNVSVAGVQFLLDGNNLGAEDLSSPYSVSWNTATVSNGTHILTAKARDAAGNNTTSTAITVTVDNILPSGAITSPAVGIIAGNVDITINASDNNSVAGVQFLLNGANLGAEDVSAPYLFTWNTPGVADGNYTLTARVRDVAGNITTSAPVVVNVLNHPPDTEFPTVSITSPAAGEIIGTINITATANDNTGMVGVQFLLNGVNFGAEDLTAPYSVSWNTTSLANGDYTLTAKARDAAGNITTSDAVVVTVNNPPDSELPAVDLASPLAGNVSGTITVSANASDNVGVVGIQFLLDGNNLGAEDLIAPYSIPWNTKLVANGTYTVTAKARDGAGNINISTGVVITIDNDYTLPAVDITSPTSGNVSGTTNITANASDNVGVTGVQFLLDGNNLGAEDLTAPYSVSWNTTSLSNGNHTLTAKARDAAGNITTSSPVIVSVANINPVISAISVNSITESSAIITWTTSFGATSQVNHGTTSSYGLSTLVDSALVTTHSMILTSLAPGTVYHYQVLSGNAGGSPTVSGDNVFTTAGLAATLGTLNTHTIFAFPAGKIVPWTPNPTDGYNTVVTLAWNYLLNSVPNDPLTGKPAYYSRSYLDPNTQQVVNWDHNPAGMYSMLIESGLKYYAYSGNANVMQLAIDVAIWHLDHGMTLPTDSWANVPYSEGPYGSLTYNGANTADGVGNLEPDKIGELGYGMLQLYKFNGNTRFRDAAIQFANVLAAKVRTGNQTQSPWPHRVRANNGSSVEDYGADIIGPISLFDGLIAAGLGNTTAYQTARTTAWNWMMTYPMQNNVWSQYFEDVAVEGNYNSNLNQYDAMMAARYLLEHPEFDVNWETHVRGLITWVENTFGQASFGATAIKEQQVFPWIMGSHTSRYASVNALLYEKTGDLVAKEKAYRSFNWATYMARSNGVVIDGPDVNNQWFSDGYGDYIRHFMTGMGAVPEWSPASQTHLVQSNSVIKSITYGVNTLSYTTFNSSSTEVLHISYNPVSITVDGVEIPHRSDLSQPGWTLDIATKTLKIYHTSGTNIVINPGTGSRMITQASSNNDSVVVVTSKTSDVKRQMSNTTPAIESGLMIMPNPAKGNFSLDYSTSNSGKVSVRITDAEGKIVFTTDRGVSKGHIIIPVQGHSSWRPGVYFITVQQGIMIQRKKLIYQ
ncbi:MAG: T9SS type A sorting domain-containing protein, partial [Bacteroidetes bacterium]